MIPVTDQMPPARAIAWREPALGYPWASVVVRVARDLDGRGTTGRDEDGAAR
jgi:hypothetical protein